MRHCLRYVKALKNVYYSGGVYVKRRDCSKADNHFHTCCFNLICAL